MSNRSWFYASNGQQQGPFPEGQLRDLITRGAVNADTLVWTEGMSGWQRAGEIPGLMPAGAPPQVPQAGGPPPMRGGYAGAASGGYSGGALSADLPTFGLLGRALLLIIGEVFVIPAPWTATMFYQWVIGRIHVPGRPNFGFAGKPLDIWYVFVALGLLTYGGVFDSVVIQLVGFFLQGFLGWMIIRWIASRLTSDGRELPISFKGSPLVYLGWYVLLALSAITIIGWAWVVSAWMRWICRNIEGTRREVIFNGSGLEVLWRTIVFAIGCAFLIPIPWVLKWYTNWYISQFALAERGAAV